MFMKFESKLEKWMNNPGGDEHPATECEDRPGQQYFFFNILTFKVLLKQVNNIFQYFSFQGTTKTGQKKFNILAF